MLPDKLRSNLMFTPVYGLVGTTGVGGEPSYDNSGSAVTTLYYEAPAGVWPPANISVREQTYAGTDDDWSWQFYIGGLSSPTITRNIDDGFGDPITSVNWYLSPCYEDYSSTGVHITPYQVTVVDPPQICPYDGNTDTGIVTLSTRQVSDKISASGNQSNYDVQVSAGWYDAISADTRAVIINQPQTTKKEVVTNGSPDGGILFDSDGDPLLVMPPPNNTADADGTMYGDIGIPDGEYAYEFGPGYGETLQPQQDSLKVKYEAALTGSWSANPITFAWSSNLGSTEYVPPPQPTVPVFWDQYWGAEISMDGSKVQDCGDTEKTATIKVAATDPADGATATAKYEMTIHRGIVILPSNKTSSRVDELLTLQDPGPYKVAVNGGQSLELVALYPDWIIAGGVVVLGTASAIPGMEWLAPVCAFLSLTADLRIPVKPITYSD